MGADAHSDALAASEEAKEELDNMPLLGDIDQDTETMSSNTHLRAAFEARLNDLNVVAQEKETASRAAIAAAAAAKEELQDLESRHASSRIAQRPLKQIIREELDILEACLKGHEECGTAIMAEAREIKVAWTKENETLGADLHRAQLQAALAEEGVNIASGLAKSLRTDKAEKDPRHAPRIATHDHISDHVIISDRPRTM